jgi:HSP20 family protein
MDIEKLKQWMEIAQNMQGGDFWKNIFDQDFAKQFINDQPFKPAGTESESTKTQPTAPQTFPLIDILEGEKEVVVIIELAGIKKEDIQLGLSGDILTVKGIKKKMYPHLKLSRKNLPS